ncbi:HSP70-5 [Ramazzottius varieornatus]|uniref:HSP70-5 n=1 Tax=Ramazzottius varieornatus TaxID=947166 RepID=A0A1D1W3L0_RAMVA|nr:HSP70-5 [Ramazzottius varieornatus]
MGGVLQRQKSEDFSQRTTRQKVVPSASDTEQFFHFTSSETTSRNMSVVGIDLGNQSSYIATARAGGIEMILNDYSMRDTPTYVAFTSKSRSIGVAARNNLIANLNSTIFNLKRLLGRDFQDPFVQRELKYLPFTLQEAPDGGIGIKVSYLGKDQWFNPEQVCAMFLGKLKEISEADLKVTVTDCVISVPIYYTDVERRALLAAAQIAGLNVLKLMNDTTAVALSYGLYATDLPDADQPPRTVVFLDVGYATTQLVAASFNRGKLKVLATAVDPHLGGRDLDYALVEHFAKEFKDKYKIDVLGSKRATIRLRDECEKLKKLMSSIANEIPLNIECFMNDKDVSGRLKREDFENLVPDYFQRTEQKIRELLDALKDVKVDRVEVIGGGIRIPAIKALVKKVFAMEPATSLNSDEAVARGCAIQCAILSPTLKVKEFSVTDVCPYGIELRWPQTGSSPAGALEVFPRNHASPFSKIVTLNRSEPFTLEASYAANQNIPINALWIGTFKINDVKPSLGETSAKVRIKSRVGLNGLFSLTNAYREEIVMVEEDAAAVQIQPMEVDEQTPKTDGPVGVERSDSTTMDVDQPTSGGTASSPEKAKTKRQAKQIELKIDSEFPEYPQQKVQEFIEQENEMRSQDRAEKEKADSRNALEEYIYEIRGKIGGDYSDYVTETDREKLSALLTQAEDWLYSDGEDQAKSVYSEKLKNLQAHGQPIAFRYRDAQERPALFQEMAHYMQMTRKAADAYRAGEEKYSHLESKDVEQMMKTLDEKQRWLDEKMNSQAKKSQHEDPVVSVADLKKEKTALEKTVNAVLNKPKPKPTPKKAEPPKQETKTKQDGDVNQNNGENANEDVSMDNQD